MKITKTRLRQIIKEELEAVMQEIEAEDDAINEEEKKQAAIDELNAAMAQSMFEK